MFRSLRPFPSLRLLPALTVAALVTGCDVYDEQVHSTSSPRSWSSAVASTTARHDLPRSAAKGDTSLEFVEGFEAGARRATAAGMPLLLVFRASWCRWSGEVTRGPLAERELVGLARGFVCVAVDADRDAGTCAAFDVHGFPTLIVLDLDGRERFRATGGQAARGLVAALQGVLARPAGAARLAGGHEEPRR